MLTHRNLTAMTLAHLADIDAPDEGCSLVHAAPMSHGSGLYIPAYVLRGARQVVPASCRFDPGEFLDLCDHHPGCSAFLAPTMVQRLVETGRERPRHLRTIIYGGGPMYLQNIKKALAAFGPVFAQIYGQGEAPMTITGLRRVDHETADDAILRSVGYPRSGVEVAVLRDDGTRRPSAKLVRSFAAATLSCAAIGMTRRPPARRCRTAGYAPVTSVPSTSAAT
ncbi:AMP-binding enzyme family protein [Mycobacterium xenopi 4042]|uniref:AMP-binding enzyme family protein n=1 Tax=Mycobacterium xenopi 4042 TaxID=1299334 RepID=X8CKW5_MYCXE|nr:AMP-binding enzyme family protein [Mycobacterium xenopi 4042]